MFYNMITVAKQETVARIIIMITIIIIKVIIIYHSWNTINVRRVWMFE